MKPATLQQALAPLMDRLVSQLSWVSWELTELQALCERAERGEVAMVDEALAWMVAYGSAELAAEHMRGKGMRVNDEQGERLVRAGDLYEIAQLGFNANQVLRMRALMLLTQPATALN